MSLRSTNCCRRWRALKGFRWAGICALGLVLLGRPQYASAEFFQFSTAVTLSNIVNPPSGLAGNGSPLVTLTSALGTVFTLTGESSTGSDNIDGSGFGTDIVFVDIAAAVNAGTLLETVSFDYSFQLNIDDYGSSPTGGTIQGSGIFTINGTLVETVGAGKKISLVSNTFTSPATQSQVIAGQQYTVSLYGLVPPGAANSGVFGLHVSPVPIPEPGTLALLGLGTFGLAIPALRRWRRKA